MSNIGDDGVRLNTNEPDTKRSYYKDYIFLQDLIKFQGYQYEIVEGLYYEARNYTIQTVIQKMFNNRKLYKIFKNPIQIIYKLMMNSSYGKTIMKNQDSYFEVVNFM